MGVQFSSKMFSWLHLLVCLLCLQRSAAFVKTTCIPSHRLSNDASTLSLSSSDLLSVSVGFIGCGTIAKAIATGLATQDEVTLKSVAVSRRSESKSKALQESFPSLVTVHDDNQHVVDTSDIVFITVLPQQASFVLRGLTFDKARHSLVSLVSTSTLDGLASDTKLPPEQVSKVICTLKTENTLVFSK
jgi:lactate dehydrogenase-like 2-hydroxyacid dehydrogenase